MLTDGAALVQAWESPGERPRLEPLLRELRAWPRLLLVDLGDGELTRLAREWRLPVRNGQGLPGWLAGVSTTTAASEHAHSSVPDPAQLDLWAAGLGPERGPTWDWGRLPVVVRWRLRALGLGGHAAGAYRLRRTARHHLALALLAGIAVGGLGWGLERLLRPHQGGAAVFADARFQEQVRIVPAAAGTRLGSPWHLSARPKLGPLAAPYTWAWRPIPADNPEPLGDQSELLVSGRQHFPIRACAPGWPGPGRSLAAIAAEADLRTFS